MDVTIRGAAEADDEALAVLDRACWSVLAEVSPRRPVGTAFFGAGRTLPADVLVAAEGRAVVGYLKLAPPTALASNSHVQQVQGLAVDPGRRRAGTARSLIAAGVDLARRRQARKVNLRVLGTNEPALALFRSAGFTVEGVLREEFFLDGRYVDDLLMALRLP